MLCSVSVTPTANNPLTCGDHIDPASIGHLAAADADVVEDTAVVEGVG